MGGGEEGGFSAEDMFVIPQLNAVKFSCADRAVSRDRSGNSGFEFGRALCDHVPGKSVMVVSSLPWLAERAHGHAQYQVHRCSLGVILNWSRVELFTF